MTRAYIILPIFNEADSLAFVVSQISKTPLEHFSIQIIAVNDGSTDGSLQILTELAKKYPLTILSHVPNRGIPASFSQAFTYLGTVLTDEDIVVIMESDGTSDANLLPILEAEIEKGADIVIASRHAKGGRYIRFPWYRTLGSSIINYFLSIVWHIENVRDYTIFYRVYRGSLLKKYIHDKVVLRAKKSFAYNGELLLHLSAYSPKIVEVPLHYDYGLKVGPSKMKLLQTLLEYLRITPLPKLHRQPIFWVAVFAFLIRVWGITYGFPDLLVLDEPALTRGALTMLKLHTLIPALHESDFSTLYYPPLGSYLYLLVLVPVIGIQFLLSGTHSLSAFANQLTLDPTVPWIATRFVSAVLGSLSVYFLGRLSERIYKGSGVYAALFLATSFLAVTFSHIARHWSLSTLLIVGMLWCAYKIYYSPSRRWYILAGIFSGLGFGSGVITGALILVPGLAHLARSEPFQSKLFSRALWIMVSIASALLVFFMALHPLILHNLLKGGDAQGVTVTTHKTLAGFFETYFFAVRDLAQSETILLIFASIGSIMLVRKQKIFGSVLVASVLSYISLIYLGYYYLFHYLQLILPMLALMAGIGVYEIVSLSQKRPVRIVLALLIFLLPTAIALRFSFLWAQPDTRHSARTFIETSIPKDARILSYTPDMKIVWPTKESIQERLLVDPSSNRVTDTVLLGLPLSEYPSPAFSVFEMATMSPTLMQPESLAWLNEKHFSYVVIDRRATPLPAVNALAKEGTLVASFPSRGSAIDIIDNDFGGPALDVFRISQMGPRVDIIKLPN